VFSIAANPANPVHIQTLDLKGPKGPSFNFMVTASLWDTTPFQLQTSPDGGFLYVVNHEESLTGNAAGNAIHILKRAADGTLSEIASSPLVFPALEVPATAHPLGVVVF
jgi:hypothetical protein